MKSLIPTVLFIVLMTFTVCEAKWKKSTPPPPTTKAPGVEGPSEADIQAFKEWELHFSKEYATEEEEEAAMAKYFENKAKIEEHNKKFEEGEVTFTRGLFKYSDLTPEEKQKYLTGLAVPPSHQQISQRSLPNSIFPPGPPSVDWRKSGLVGPIQDQGWCGSCWAFSATGVLEGVLRRKGIKDVQLAPQQLVDCSTRWCWGCQSGWAKYALDYVKANGITKESTYPYKMETQTCTYSNKTAAGFINNVYNVPVNGKDSVCVLSSIIKFCFYSE
jgi:C1A family cysteine protease